MSQLSVCDFCKDKILLSSKSWDYHQPSYASLEKSAGSRCAFCIPLYEAVLHRRELIFEFCEANKATLSRWLREDVRQDATALSGDSSTAALFRWSIRSLGRMREGKEMIALTLRPVPQKRSSGNNKTDRNGSQQNVAARAETFGLPELTFYCFPEADMGPLLDRSDIGVSTNPEANGGLQIKRWVQTCDREHKYCPAHARQQESSGFVPTRLLVVGRRGSTAPIKVIETRPNNIRGPYVTLSHCWGVSKGDRRDTLLQENKQQFMSIGIPWGWLSRNFQQAIEVARFLDMEYCWIDSLCIIQRDKEDWAHEGQLMHKVYRHSYCNIAAADSEDSAGGLFRKREPWQVSPARFVAARGNNMFGRGREGRAWRIVREDLWEEGLLRTPLYTRGWVFQERMLAPRILHFCRHQVFWDCPEMSSCETVPSGLPLPLDYLASADRHWRGRLQESGGNRLISVSGKNDDSIEDFWKVAVKNYTTCNLTFQTDKRIAIWGIAKLVRDGLGEEYGAGMWEHYLEEQLAWTVTDWHAAERPQSLLSNPSWSWTSVKGTISLENRSPLLQFREYTVKNHQGEPLSFSVKGGITRPLLHRERSGDPKEDVAVMSKELESVEEKRKALSRKATVQLLQDAINTPRQAWIAGILLRVWSLLIVMYSRVYLPSHQQPPQHPAPGYHTSRDKEPSLVDNAIDIQGYINRGTLQWSATTGKCNLHLDSWEDAVIDAYPDTIADVEHAVSCFMILALSQHSERHTSLPFSSEPTEGSWYTGVGILIRPSPSHAGCFVRTGALQVRHLSADAWKHLQVEGQILHGAEQATKDEAGLKFFLE